MKLLTLNTHSLEEPGYVEKTEKFIEMLSKEQPDIVALQEVNQSQNEAELRMPCWTAISDVADLNFRSDRIIMQDM